MKHVAFLGVGLLLGCLTLGGQPGKDPIGFDRARLLADRSPLKSVKVVIMDCAQGGQAMAKPWFAAPAAGTAPQGH